MSIEVKNLVKSFDDLLENEGFAGFETDEYVALGLGFAAEPKNKIIKALMESYENLNFVNEDGSLNLVASPELNTDTLESLGLKRNGQTQVIDGFTFFPADYFCPKSFNDGILRMTKNTHSIHHYDASWFTEEQQKAKELRWKQKQKKARIKRIRKIIKGIGTKLLGEKLYKKLRGVKE